MPLTFREDRATQVASKLLEMAGGALNVLPLVKLIYLVDRTYLERHGRSVTMDTFFNMANGPVLSSTMDCINAETAEDAPIWTRHIGPRDGNEVHLIEPAAPTELSPAIEEIIEEVYHQHGQKSFREWIDFSHSLPEWQDPGEKKRLHLKYRDVLRAAGWDDEDEVLGVVHDLTAQAKADRLFG